MDKEEQLMKEFVIVEDGKLVRYRRHGSCNICGDCCVKKDISAQSTIGLAYDPNCSRMAGKIEEVDDWADFEGWSAHCQYKAWWWWKAEISDRKGAVCDCFEDGKCILWGTDDFPAFCRDWPMHPDNVKHFPRCGFWFEKIMLPAPPLKQK